MLAAITLLLATELASAQTYWPGKNLDWERKSPQEAGFDAAAIQRAVEIAIAGESTSPRDPAFKGYIIAEWGDPQKVDNTFSVSKSFLSTTIGVAYDTRSSSPAPRAPHPWRGGVARAGTNASCRPGNRAYTSAPQQDTQLWLFFAPRLSSNAIVSGNG